MIARSGLLIQLVVSLLVLGLALITTNNAEGELEIVSIEHYNSKIDNQINISVENEFEKEIPYSLRIDIFSDDLQNNISLDYPNLAFSIESLQTYNTSFPFKIPYSGNYTFIFTLVANNDENISEIQKKYGYSFYDREIWSLEDTIEDYYYDQNDNANWIFDDEVQRIRLINIEDSYNTGIVLGPFDTTQKKENSLKIDLNYNKTDSAIYKISYSTEFDKTNLYSTIWEDSISLQNPEIEELSLELLDDSSVYIRLLASDDSPDEKNHWTIINIEHRYITVKHSLKPSIQKHSFFNIDSDPETIVSLENTGIFNQQLGNISVELQLFSINGMLESHIRRPDIPSGENFNLEVRWQKITSPGNYYAKINITLINKEIYNYEMTSFISYSTIDLGQYNLNFENIDSLVRVPTEFKRLNLLIESSEIELLEFSNNPSISHLSENFYIVEIEKVSDEITISSNKTNFLGKIISCISMDEKGFNVHTEEEYEETIEGIIAPSIYFDEIRAYYLNFVISNDGFYTEEYEITYIFASTFIDSFNAPEKIIVEAGKSVTNTVEITPLQTVPREGGSQFNIEIFNNGESQILNYILAYSNTDIDIVNVECDRHSILLGQSINCNTVLKNEGFATEDISVDIGVIYLKDDKITINDVVINRLENKEIWSINNMYTPEKEGEFKIFVEIKNRKGQITYHETTENINVVSSISENLNRNDNFVLPDINISGGIITISILGIIYQFRRSENLKYLAYSFIVPLYSRLQKDTLSDQGTRQKIINAIYSKPGINLTNLKDNLGLHNGTLAHHLNILENHTIVSSIRSGRQRLFFPYNNINQIKTRSLLITNITQKNIIKIVKENPGITQSMISQRLNLSRQNVNYHVNSLITNSMLKIEKQGRISRLYPTHFT